ncbi:MAG: DUF6484 domain-containing protein [Methylobacter sp.]
MNAKVADAELMLVTGDASTQTDPQEKKVIDIPLTSKPLTECPPGVTIGRLVGFQDGWPLVHYSGCPNDEGLPAQSIVVLSPDNIGKSILLAFEGANPERPIVIGLMIEPETNKAGMMPVDLKLDDERILLTAEREIVLRCGESSITLTRAGKVLIKGAYVLSRSSGYNKIKGAAVDIN